MEESPLHLVQQDTLDRFDTVRTIKQRNEALNAQEAELMARRDAAQTVGEAVGDLWKDEEYERIHAERHELLVALRQHLEAPRLGKDQAAELRKQLKPEEKSQLRREMLHRLQYLPAEDKAELAATVERVSEKVASQHGLSPEMEASFARVKKLQDQINQVEDDQ